MQWCSGKLQAQKGEKIKQQEGAEEVLAWEGMPPPLAQPHLVVNCLFFCNLPPFFIYQKLIYTYLHIYISSDPSWTSKLLPHSQTPGYVPVAVTDRGCSGDDCLGSWEAARHGVKNP